MFKWAKLCFSSYCRLITRLDRSSDMEVIAKLFARMTWKSLGESTITTSTTLTKFPLMSAPVISELNPVTQKYNQFYVVTNHVMRSSFRFTETKQPLSPLQMVPLLLKGLQLNYLAKLNHENCFQYREQKLSEVTNFSLEAKKSILLFTHDRDDRYYDNPVSGPGPSS